MQVSINQKIERSMRFFRRDHSLRLISSRFRPNQMGAIVSRGALVEKIVFPFSVFFDFGHF